MNNIVLQNNKLPGLLIAMLFALAWPLHAKTPANAAKSRATLYQAETATVLVSHKWRIVSDKPGTLVAEESYNATQPLSGPGIYTIVFARLTIQYSPQTAGHTKCSAVIVGYGDGRDAYSRHRTYVTKDGDESPKLIGPLPFATPENVKKVQDLLAEAEKQLLAEHPEYRAR